MRAAQVLVVEDNTDIARMVKGILEEEGFTVALLTPAAPAALQAAVARWEPDCILLDGAGRGAYGQSWHDAARLCRRARSTPVIMFSVDAGATQEARAGTATRSQAASFAAILTKPFDLDNLVAVVTGVLGRRQQRAARP